MGATCSREAVHDDLKVAKPEKNGLEEGKISVVATSVVASASGSQENGVGGDERDTYVNVTPLSKGNDHEGVGKGDVIGVLSPKKAGTQGEHGARRAAAVRKLERLDRLGSVPEELDSQVMVGIANVTSPKQNEVEVRRDRAEGFCKRGTIGHGAFYSLVSGLDDAVVFRDPEFPPDLSSLCDPGDEEQVQRFGGFEWKRPSEIFPGTFQLFLEDIEPDDIHQGSLGDCYFLSVLGSLAEWPKRIRKMFASDSLDPHGCYGVHFCVRGEWRTVVVDDIFPCHPDAGGPAFSRGNGSEIWVMILEKAWAKLHGSYYTIEAGLMSDCLWSFTGAPVTVLSSNDSSVWDLMLRGEKMDWIMNAGCTENAQQVADVGLVASHAYSLLAVHELETPQGIVRLVQLRNPWGYGEWTGKWSDSSKMWTEQLREQLGGVHVSDDGIFFMHFDDFRTYFPSISVCKYFDDFSTTSVQKEISLGSVLAFSVEVEEASLCYFTAHQDCMRFASDPSKHKYSAVSIIIGRKGEYCAAKTEASREVSVEIDAVPGTYYVWMRAFWEGENPSGNDPLTRYLGFSTYTAKPTKVLELTKRKSKTFFYDMYLDHARKNCVLEDYSSLGEPQCFKGSTNLQEGSYIYYHNKSTSNLTEEIDFVELEGLQLVQPYMGKNAEVFVPPGSEHLILLSPITKGNRSWAAQSWSKFDMPVEKLVNAAKTCGNVTHRTYDGANIDLMVYTYVHQSGAVYHFENTTEDMAWTERWTFDIQNLIIVGHNDTCIEINLLPGASKTICFERVGRDEWKLGASIADLKVCKNGAV